MGTTRSWESVPASQHESHCVLEGIPCAALLFDRHGRLLAANTRADDLHVGISKDVCTFEELAPKVDVAGTALSAAELLETLLSGAACIQYQQHVNGTGPPRWLLCQASTVPQPATGSQLIMLLQLDITESRKKYVALEASADRMQEQLQALQRKLVHVVTENEAMRHVVDKLQCHVLGLQRQMQGAGLEPVMPLDEELLRPCPHQSILSVMVGGMGDAGSTHGKDIDEDFDAMPTGELGNGHDPLSTRTQSLEMPHDGQHVQDDQWLHQSHAAQQGLGMHNQHNTVSGVHPAHRAPASAGRLMRHSTLDKVVADVVKYKSGYNNLLAEVAEQQEELDKAHADAVEMKAGYDKVLADSVEQQEQLDKAAEDAAVMKAGYDKLVADSAQHTAQHATEAAFQKAQFDKLAADSAALKAAYDQQEAQLAKAAADAAEFKAGYDKLMIDTAEQKAQHDLHSAARQAHLDKATADAAEFKAGYDKLLSDSVEHKAQYDKAAADAAELKAGYDKLVNDSIEQKAQHDHDSAVQQARLAKATADAAEFKAGYDKLMVDSAEQKAQYDKTAADAAEFKAGYDKLMVDSAEQQAHLDKAAADAVEMKAGYDKLMVESSEQKAQYDMQSAVQQARLAKATADAAEFKAGYDKLMVDSAEQQAHLDKAAADAVEMKAGYDKLMVDSTEQKAQYDMQSALQQARLAKATADAAEFKAGFDKLMVDSTEQKAQLDKAAADATEYKAGFDKLMMDSAEQKAQLDKATADATEFKAGYDKLMVDSAEQKAQLDKAAADATEYKAGFDKAAADAAEFKAGFDKLLVDSTEQKAQLDKATADAAEFKAGYDKLLVDSTEQKAQLDKAAADATEYKAGYDKAAADAAEFKAGFDKLVVDSVEQKAQLDKATADAAEFKAGFDKVMADSAEQKAQLDKATADAAEFKAGYDKLMVDSTEQKAQLDKAAADATEYKAGFDKAAADAAEFKAGYDKLIVDSTEQQAQVDKLTADAAELKSGYDKLAVDSSEQKAQLDKATADAAEFKAGYDKLVVDTVEQKAQLDKATADATEFKAGYDKLIVDSSEQKAQLDKATADASEMKAGFDKVLADSVEQKAQLDKVTADAAEFKAGYDKLTTDAAEYKAEADRRKAAADTAMAQINRMAEDMSQVQEQLLRERENFSALHDQHLQLQRQQEVLAAELMVALGSYKPKANIDAGTPADKLLQMLTDLLDGTLPNLQDILLIQSSILEARDIYQPWRLGKQLLETKEFEDQVGMSLVYLLGDTETLQQNQPQPVSLQELCDQRKVSGSASPSSSSSDLTAPVKDLHAMLADIINTRRSRDVGNKRRNHRANMARAGSSAGMLAADAQQHLNSKAGQLLQELARRRSASSAGSGAVLRRLQRDSITGRRAAELLHSAAGATLDCGGSSSSSSGESLAEELRQLSEDEQQPSELAGGEDVPERALSVLSRDDSGVSGTGTAKLPRPQAAPMDQLELVLASANEWQFDAFALADASAGHPLSTLAFYLFHKQGLIEHYHLKPTALARFLRRVEAGYKDNPYHNATHAADVLQTLHCIVTRGGLMPGYVDPLHLLGCYTAAVVHDFEHGGLTNDFLVSSLDRLAVRYNDRSPLENHHLAAAFTLMHEADFNFIAGLPKAEFEKFRKVVIELVLATDMKQHFSILSHFTTVHRLNAGGAMTPGTSGSDPMLSLRQQARSENSTNNSCSVDQDKIVLPLDENERVLGLQMALKCADVGHVTAALPVHIRWVAQLEEEFFRQGDVERASSLNISPLFDRAKQGITKSQVGFFDIVIIPLFHTFSKVFGNCKPLLTYVMRNYRYWADQANAANKS